jgi:beta-lactamase regulating signal transducer with metallopeptidase domain
MFQWLFYVMVVSAILSAAGMLAERALRQRLWPTRLVWLGAMGLCVLLSLRAMLADTAQNPGAQSTPALKTSAPSPGAPSSSAIAGPVMPIRLPDVLARAKNQPRTEAMVRLDAALPEIWLGLSALMLLGLATSAVQVYARRRRWPLRMVESCCVGISKDVGPAVVGLVRPTIVLPQWFLARPSGEQRLILAHEVSHVQARDPLALSVAVLALVSMPWNPLLWWQMHRLRHAIEVDCDSRVLNAGHDLATYGKALIEVGTRRSRYLGTVAAMSEGRTLLEKRIEIMSQRAQKRWKLGFAVLSAASLSAAFAATQLTTPTVTPASEVTLDAATLTRYVGHYQINPGVILTIARDGTQLRATLTGQPTFPIYADSPTEFHWKVVPARVTFSGDANGLAATATIHQNGAEIPALRIDDAAAAEAQQQIRDRINANQPEPGSSAALRKTVEAMVSGTPNYGDMTDALQNVVREQKSASSAFLSKLGAVETVKFRGVSDAGADKYLVTHRSGKQSQWIIELASDGRIATLAAMPVF